MKKVIKKENSILDEDKEKILELYFKKMYSYEQIIKFFKKKYSYPILRQFLFNYIDNK